MNGGGRQNRKRAERISIEHLDRICEVLDCNVADILEHIPNKQPHTGDNLILEEHGDWKMSG